MVSPSTSEYHHCILSVFLKFRMNIMFKMFISYSTYTGSLGHAGLMPAFWCIGPLWGVGWLRVLQKYLNHTTRHDFFIIPNVSPKSWSFIINHFIMIYVIRSLNFLTVLKYIYFRYNWIFSFEESHLTKDSNICNH